MQLNAVWAGARLSYIEQVCLASAIDAGHHLDLWTYGPIEGVPPGVRIRDAREVMPENLMVRHHGKSKSYAIGADVFRLLLLQQQRGCYIDCDMFLLKPIQDEAYIFGLESPGRANNAVLRLPYGSPVLNELLTLAHAAPVIAPWLPWRRKLKQYGRKLIGANCGIAQAPWGTIGPVGLTYYANRYGLSHLAKEIDVFYALPGECANDIFRAPDLVERHFTADTVAAHLWHSKLIEASAPPAGSWIAAQCDRLGVSQSAPVPQAA